MDIYRNRDITRLDLTHSLAVQPPSIGYSFFRFTATCILSLGFYLLICSTSFAAINDIPDPSKFEQRTTIRSFSETTTLAEDLWANLTNRFVSLYEKGEYPTALSIAQRTYEIAINNFGIDDVNTADTLLKLGIINQTLGKLSLAEDHLLGALVILEDQLSPDHPDVAVIATNLGNVYFDMKRFDASEKYHQLALKIRQNAFGNSNPSVAQSNYNLAVLYEHEKKYSKAESLYQEAIIVWSESVGPTHPYIGNALGSLTNVYTAQEKFQDAENVLRQTLAYKKTIYGTQHEEVAQTLINLGTTYLELGKFNSASTAYAEALNIAQHLLTSSDPQLALLMYSLANIYHMQARMGINAITTTETATPSENSANAPQEIIETADNTSEQSTALFKQAIPLYKKAAEILDSEKSKNWSTLDVVLTELAMTYKAIGNTDMAAATESRLSTH